MAKVPSQQLRAEEIFRTICSELRRHYLNFTRSIRLPRYSFCMVEQLPSLFFFFSHFSSSRRFFLSAWRQNEIHFSAVNTFVVRLIITFLLSCFPRFHPYMWRQFKREKWDNRKPRISIRISKWSELYLGDRCWRGKQDSYSFSVLRSRGGIWFFISLWWASAPGELQNKVRTRSLIVAHPKMWCGAEK